MAIGRGPEEVVFPRGMSQVPKINVTPDAAPIIKKGKDEKRMHERDLFSNQFNTGVKENKSKNKDKSKKTNKSSLVVRNVASLMYSRAGPPSQKWSDQQITVNPTGSIHKKARGKSLIQKKLILIRGF